MREVVILGSTGSIGTQALEVIEARPGKFRVRALAAGGSNLELLAKQVMFTNAEVVAIASGDPQEFLTILRAFQTQVGLVKEPPQILTGEKGVREVAGLFPQAVVLNGIAGGIGLRSSLQALLSGATLALANKESLVVGGPLIRKAMVRPGQIVPVDSEHSAVYQALRAGVHNRGLCTTNTDGRSELSHLILTASGGPFRGRNRASLENIKPSQALAHPTWNMGPLVTINSSTLVNKGLEVIEASLLFDVPPERVKTVVHPQSIVHSMVCWQDGSTIAQASPPDMKLPIALGLSSEERLTEVSLPCDWDKPVAWTFEPVDNETFPAVELARYALSTSPTHPAVYNAANEVLVAAFLEEQIGYLDIVDTLVKVVNEHEGVADPALDTIMEVQDWAERRAGELVSKL